MTSEGSLGTPPATASLSFLREQKRWFLPTVTSLKTYPIENGYMPVFDRVKFHFLGYFGVSRHYASL